MHYYIEHDFRQSKIRDGGLFWIKTVFVVSVLILTVALVANLWTT
jgi:hypothetical protein